MKVYHATHPDMVVGATAAELREWFLLSGLFVADQICLNYSHVERLIAGGAAPVSRPLKLTTDLSRRELGVINIGAPGRVRVDGRSYALDSHDGLYVGLGSQDVVFEPAGRFYIVSAPAHARFDTVAIAAGQAKSLRLGSQATSNQRTIRQYIHPEVCRSAQLLLGLTALDAGSVWNTLPAHRHERRSEIYFYFDMQPDDRVFHFMGEPGETRHLIVANEQAVIAPPWSIHMGAGTSRYSFIWSMAGDNQDYTDMDAVPTPGLL